MHHLLDKLDEAAIRAELGRPYPVTKLSAVIPLVGGQSRSNGERPFRYAHYLRHLLRTARDDLLAGRSLSARHELTPEATASLLDAAREQLGHFLAARHPGPSAVASAKRLHDEIEAIRPGTKRVWVHATRRRLEDADLLLSEYALWAPHVGWRYAENAYAASVYFVTSYANKRYHVPPESARRWREIHRYWASHYAEDDR